MALAEEQIEIALLPCPFCGGKSGFDHDDDGWNWIACESCGTSSTASVSAMEDCKPILAERWNRRTEAPIAHPASETEEDFCYCGKNISLQMVSGGAAEEGLYGRITCRMGDGSYQEYVKVQPASAPSEQKPRFECWSTNEGDSWYEHPADAELLYDVLGDSPKVGDEFEVMAGWCSVPARYRIVSQKDDDFEVECISHPEATAPQPDYKAQRDAERYRWIRTYEIGKVISAIRSQDSVFFFEDSLDAAIDAAIASVKGGE